MSHSDAGDAEQQNEGWLPVPGYESYYEVSSLGRVRSLPRTIYKNYKDGPRATYLKGVVLASSLTTSGYRCVGLSLRGRVRTWPVHKLVLEAFVGPAPQHCECRHLNGDKLDNKVSNLSWGTKQENAKDQDRHGTRRRGVNAVGAVLTAEQVRDIRNSTDTHVSIAARFGVSPTTIRRVRNGSRYKRSGGVVKNSGYDNRRRHPAQRKEAVAMFLSGVNVKTVAARFSVLPITVQRWAVRIDRRTGLLPSEQRARSGAETDTRRLDNDEEVEP